MTVIKKEYNQRNIVNQLLIDNDLDADEGYLDMVRKREERAREVEEQEELEKAEKATNAAVIWD